MASAMQQGVLFSLAKDLGKEPGLHSSSKSQQIRRHLDPGWHSYFQRKVPNGRSQVYIMSQIKRRTLATFHAGARLPEYLQYWVACFFIMSLAFQIFNQNKWFLYVKILDVISWCCQLLEYVWFYAIAALQRQRIQEI